MLEKTATIERFEYPPLGSELKKRTNTAKKQYQGLERTHGFDKASKEPALNTYKESDLVYKDKHSFYRCHDIKRFKNISFETKYDELDDFYRDLNNF